MTDSQFCFGPTLQLFFIDGEIGCCFLYISENNQNDVMLTIHC